VRFSFPPSPQSLFSWAQTLVRQLEQEIAHLKPVTAGTVTLSTGTTTTVPEIMVTASSTIVLIPTSADAASVDGMGWRITAKTQRVSFEVTHPAFATETRTYQFLVIG
jgi:hypothetical protein